MHYSLRSCIAENKIQGFHFVKLPTHMDSEHSQAKPASFFHQAYARTYICKEYLVQIDPNHHLNFGTLIMVSYLHKNN